LEQIIGRKPISLHEALTDNASAFKKAWSRSCNQYYHHPAAQKILEE
jgi:hypothetical protein